MLANLGIPLIGAAISLGWFTVIPVAILETVLARNLLRWHFLFALWWVTLANLFTMLLGIPLTWLLVVLLSAITGGGSRGDGSIADFLRSPAWLGPGYEHDLAWAAPLGLIVLCVPFFLMSWWLEYLFLRNFAADGTKDGRTLLWNFAWKANLLSYSFLVVLLIGVMVWPLL